MPLASACGKEVVRALGTSAGNMYGINVSVEAVQSCIYPKA